MLPPELCGAYITNEPGTNMLLPLFVALSASAFAADTPSWWLRQSVGGQLFPEGAQSDTRAQYRVPLHRSESRLFQTTYAGAGLRAVFTPVNAEVGPRLSIAPIDVFELELQASYLGYYSWGGRGLLPFSTTEGKGSDEREAREAEGFMASGLQLAATPTVKLKFGPVVVFDSATFSALHLENPDGLDAPYVYEPNRDLVVAWDDVLIENQGGVLVELLPGGDKPLLRVGATARYRAALVSGDESTAVGGIVSFKPGTTPAVPTINVLALAYVADADRVGTVPNLQASATWVFETPAGAARPAKP